MAGVRGKETERRKVVYLVSGTTDFFLSTGRFTSLRSGLVQTSSAREDNTC